MKKSKPFSSMNYLTVNTEDYLPSAGLTRNRFSRSVSPTCSNSSYFGPITRSPSQLSSMSISSYGIRNDSCDSCDLDREVRLKNAKSSEQLCFGRAKKLMHRRAYLDEVYRPRCYTDPELKPSAKQLRVPTLTVRAESPISSPKASPKNKRSKGDRSTLNSLIEQTLKVTTASVGLRTTSNVGLSQQNLELFTEDVSRRLSSVCLYY